MVEALLRVDACVRVVERLLLAEGSLEEVLLGVSDCVALPDEEAEFEDVCVAVSLGDGVLLRDLVRVLVEDYFEGDDVGAEVGERVPVGEGVGVD